MTDAIHHPGCWNKPRPAPDRTLLVQDGYLGPTASVQLRMPRFISIPAIWSDASVCRYDKKATDAACVGCAHSTAIERKP